MISYRAPIHDSAIAHVTGESIFIDDRPATEGEVHVGVVGTPVAAGKLLSVDGSAALKIPGVLAVFTHKDIPHNAWGVVVHDQPILVANEIGHRDEPVALVVATTRAALQAGKKMVKVEVAEAKPILSIDAAIAKETFLYTSKGLKRGDAKAVLASAPHRLKGFFSMGGQDHFYLETQAAIAYPLEDGQIEIHSSTQHPTEVQHVCAKMLGLKQSQVVCVVKRMGGAFGGKESQATPFAAMAALVATKLKRPARLVMDRDGDMCATGKRHPFKNFYEVGFDDEGKILALDVKLYSDGGAYIDLSPPVLERAVFHVDSGYFLENVCVEARVCKTNLPSNTAFRGFGGPQGHITIESIVEDIAVYLKKDPVQVRRTNLYDGKKRNTTHYGQVVDHNKLPELFTTLLKTSEFGKRQSAVAKFNQSQKQKIRGLGFTTCKFGISFNTRFLNQASAFVAVQRDGSVQVSTGATEMGQGVNQKIRQVVAGAFELSLDDVRVMPTSTEKNHNTSATAASSGSDLNSTAAFLACEAIVRRLAWVEHCFATKTFIDREVPPCPADFIGSLKRSMPWTEVISKAYLNRIPLGEWGFYRTPKLNFDDEKRQGDAFKYFTTGAAASEIEIDTYTGELKILRVDLLMDIGRPMNEGIDRGQIVGGFIQGVGWVTSESVYFDDTGLLLSHSPTTYKIPNIQDLPRELHVDVIENNDNTVNIQGSKAVGEPPLLLCTSVFVAIKNAIAQRTGKISSLQSPATPEAILLELKRHGHTQF